MDIFHKLALCVRAHSKFDIYFFESEHAFFLYNIRNRNSAVKRLNINQFYNRFKHFLTDNLKTEFMTYILGSNADIQP